MRKEIGALQDCEGRSLLDITERFSAVDARQSGDTTDESLVQAKYKLGDQFFVEPNPILSDQYANNNQPVDMTKQEVAVALSHVRIWEQIANGSEEYVLVLEDDTVFVRDFSREMNNVWSDLTVDNKKDVAFDVLYVSYVEVKGGAKKTKTSNTFFCPARGLWCLSGYVISKRGAQKLLEQLPVRGPVDLWINFYFEQLDVYATKKSIINQRRDLISDNVYSILPILSKVGILNDVSPSTFPIKKNRKPVFVFGDRNTGLTSLAMALSMLGYRCCSDSSSLPKDELIRLLNKKRRVFDAYVNVEYLEKNSREILKKYKNSKIIFLLKNESSPMPTGKPDGVREILSYARKHSFDFLILSEKKQSKWEEVCQFLECEPPNGDYPDFADKGHRVLIEKKSSSAHNFIKQDRSPWVVPLKEWSGLHFEYKNSNSGNSYKFHDDFSSLQEEKWELLDDTFPSNLAIFDPNNFTLMKNKGATFILSNESSGVRNFKSASLRSCDSFLYGKFIATIKPPKTSGTVTGVFLHRNSPRQEIDIEFLGKDTTKMLVNVFYNPGQEGAKFDYGYRGSPYIIDLGFDASSDFHDYCIEWTESAVRWFVDEKLVHERHVWNPTPIPHLPMQFYLNLWPSRSEELAGKLPVNFDKACAEIKSTTIIQSGEGFITRGNFGGISKEINI